MFNKISWPSFISATIYALVLSACTPTLDWREVHGANGAFSILLPAKPASYSRMVNVDGQQVMMTMTAAEVDSVTYGVGTAAFPDAEKARLALTSMKSALVKNIGGTVSREQLSGDKAAGITTIEVDALGSSPASRGHPPIRLVARFVAKDKQVYQVVMMGRPDKFSNDGIDTFLNSFKMR
jgi:hypothetical protein